MPLIDLKNIEKEYGNEEVSTKILYGINVTIDQGEFVGIMGPSGSGKSTLMNIIGFLDTATSGTYLFKGVDVSSLDEDALAQYRSMEIGFVFQAFNLLAKTTVLENVKLPLLYSPKRIGEKERRDRAMAAIESVGLMHRVTHLSNQLSGGEKQRVAIARALVNDPSIILADEPTGNLDSASGLQIMKILQDLNHKGKTIVLVTHEQVTAEHARRIVMIRDGRIEKDTRIRNQKQADKLGSLK